MLSFKRAQEHTQSRSRAAGGLKERNALNTLDH